jgi:membrane protease YdiL (CAAX protease family)
MERRIKSGWVDLFVLAGMFLAAIFPAAVCVLVVADITGNLAGSDAAGFALRGPAMFTAYAVQFSVAAIGGYFWLRRGGLKLRLGVGWSVAPVILAGLVMLTATDIVIEPLLSMFPDKWFEQLARAVGRGGWAILTTVIAAPVLEELFFRGLMLESLSRKWRPWAAVGATALLFGVAHFPNQPQMISAFSYAVVMGYLYLASRSLPAVIVLHAINNGLAYLQLELWGTQGTSLRELMGNDTLYWTIYAASAVILVVAMWVIVGRVRTKNSELPLNSKMTDV